MILNGGVVAAALHVLEVGTKPGCLQFLCGLEYIM